MPSTATILRPMPDEIVEIIARGALVCDRRLLLCRNRKHGHVFLPGGHVEFGEPARAALEREMREEIGLKLVATRFLGAMETSFNQHRGPRPHAEAASPKCEASRPGRRHHELNVVFALEPDPAAAPFEPDAVCSQEPRIEFIWEPLDDLLCDSPTVTVLPPGILEIVSGRAPSSSPDSDDLWQTRWA